MISTTPRYLHLVFGCWRITFSAGTFGNHLFVSIEGNENQFTAQLQVPPEFEGCYHDYVTKQMGGHSSFCFSHVNPPLCLTASCDVSRWCQSRFFRIIPKNCHDSGGSCRSSSHSMKIPGRSGSLCRIFIYTYGISNAPLGRKGDLYGNLDTDDN